MGGRLRGQYIRGKGEAQGKCWWALSFHPTWLGLYQWTGQSISESTHKGDKLQYRGSESWGLCKWPLFRHSMGLCKASYSSGISSGKCSILVSFFIEHEVWLVRMKVELSKHRNHRPLMDFESKALLTNTSSQDQPENKIAVLEVKREVFWLVSWKNEDQAVILTCWAFLWASLRKVHYQIGNPLFYQEVRLNTKDDTVTCPQEDWLSCLR